MRGRCGCVLRAAAAAIALVAGCILAAAPGGSQDVSVGGLPVRLFARRRRLPDT
jgi:hypothetical protein